MYLCRHTQKFETWWEKKSSYSLWARYSFTASLLSTSVLKFSKSLVPWRVTVLAITFTSTRDLRWKIQRIGRLSMLSKSFSTSLRSVNLPVFIKKYDKCVNCPLSRSCHHYLVGAIIWTTPYTYLRVRADMRKCTSTHACASRAPFAPAREYPNHASHLLATCTRLSSYLWLVLYMYRTLAKERNIGPPPTLGSISC